MASVTGGHHVGGAGSGHPVVGAGSEHGAPAPLGAFSLYLITQPQSVGGGADSLLGGAQHETIAGAPSTGLGTVPSGQGSASGAGGPDTVTSVTHGLPMAGETRLATDQVITTQTHKDGTTVHLHDGSSFTLIGVTQIDSTLFHHH